MTLARQRPRAARPAMGRTELIVLMALLTAMTAFSLDAMLPALPAIAAELSPADPNRAQLILTAFVFGMGVGTLFAGPLCDAWGRRPVTIIGIAIYAGGAALAWFAPTLELVLLARVLMGLGGAGPRVTAMTIVRDRYEGREMARLLSLISVIFMVVPAIAPGIGALIIHAAGWRAIFPAFLVFGAVTLAWFATRQPETLAPENRRQIRLPVLRDGLRQMFSLPVIRLSILIQTLVFGMLFAMLSSVQGIFEQAYDRAATFPLWFALIAAVSATAGLINARLVVRIGMVRIVTAVMAIQIFLSAGMLAALALPLSPQVEFAVWMVWCASVFFQGGLTIGNVNAMAMQPAGHIAGLVASVSAALSTLGSAIIAVPIGLASDGTPRAVALGVMVLAAIAWGLSLRLRRLD